MTARATDLSLAVRIGALFTTGIVSLVSGQSDDAWVFAVHGAAGWALGLVVGWKWRRVWRRIGRPGSGRGAWASALVVATLASGFVWSSGGDLYIAGLNLMSWHFVLGVALALVVLLHAGRRARPIARADLVGRRQLLHAAAVVVAGVAAWQLQRPAAALAGWRGARRRFTGSYESGSFSGNDFPATSWVADRPRPLSSDHRLRVDGLTEAPFAIAARELGARDALVATLDCTGGFYSTQRWRGVRLGRLIDRAGPLPEAAHVRVISRTGYHWSFGLAEARGLLLATTVGDEPLSHAHGAPARVVAPGRRGFQWVKWVDRIELHEHPDPGAAASTLWSSATATGRGEACLRRL